MPLINNATNNTIGMILGNASTSMTGNLFLTIFIIIIILFAIALMFGIPLELTAVIIFPMIIAAAGYYHEFVSMAIILFFYFGVIIAKRWIFK